MDKFIVLNVLGVVSGICAAIFSTCAAIVKYRSDKAAALARAVAAEAATELERNQRANSERLAEMRLGEMRMVFAARMEIEQWRQLAMAQPTLTSYETKKVADMQNLIQGMDIALDKAKRQVSVEIVAEMRRQAEEEAKREVERKRTEAVDPKLHAFFQHIINVVDATLRKSESVGVIAILSERESEDWGTTFAFSYTSPRYKPVKAYELFPGRLLTLAIHPGVKTFGAAKDAERNDYPMVTLSFENDRVFVASVEDAFADPLMLSLRHQGGAVGASGLSEAKQFLILDLYEDYKRSEITLDEFVFRATTEGLMETLVKAATRTSPKKTGRFSD